MGFSKYLLFVEDLRFHLGFINGPYSEVSYHQCHIKFSSFLLVLSPPTRFSLQTSPSTAVFLLSETQTEIHSERLLLQFQIPLLHFLFQATPSFPDDWMLICPSIACLNSSVCFAYKHSLRVIHFSGYQGCHTRNY